MAKTPDNVRPEYIALRERGNITHEEWQQLRCNSWEWEYLTPALTNEAWLKVYKYCKSNCSRVQRPGLTYDQAMYSLHAEEAIRRMEALMAEVDTLKYQLHDARTF